MQPSHKNHPNSSKFSLSIGTIFPKIPAHRLRFAPFLSNTHIALIQQDYMQRIVHFNHEGTILHRIAFQNHRMVVRVDAGTVWVFRQEMNYRGQYADILGVWDIPNQQVQPNKQIQYSSQQAKFYFVRYYGEDDEDFKIDVELLGVWGNLAIICETKYEGYQSSPVAAIPLSIKLTYYELIPKDKTNSEKSSQRIIKTHTYYHRIDKNKEKSKIKAIGINNKGTIAFINQFNYKQQQQIHFQIYEFDQSTRQGDLRQINFTPCLERSDICSINIQHVWEARPHQFYIKLKNNIKDQQSKWGVFLCQQLIYNELTNKIRQVTYQIKQNQQYQIIFYSQFPSRQIRYSKESYSYSRPVYIVHLQAAGENVLQKVLQQIKNIKQVHFHDNKLTTYDIKSDNLLIACRKIKEFGYEIGQTSAFFLTQIINNCDQDLLLTVSQLISQQ